MMKRIAVLSLSISTLLCLASLPILGAAISAKLSASAHGKEHTDCLSVPNQQH
jgi:hypothetical protein